MVTNINLVSPEVDNKSKLSGKSALVLSISLVVIVALAYGAVVYLKSSYDKQNKALGKSIEDEKKKLTGDSYSELFDFQERLVLLDKIVTDHSYWDLFLKDFSRYVIPEVTLTRLSYIEKGDALKLVGFATNYESLSRELILLRDYPGAKSVEFKNTSEESGNDASQGGVSLNVDIQLDKSVLKK
jgi:Tfp pilus assembly protein PilN